MGAFCTRTICNIEKGDENYNKLINRNNMEKKKPEFEAVPSREKVPENDEMPMTPSPEPKPAYTHSIPNSSIPTPQTSHTSMSMSTIPTPSAADTSMSFKHAQVPTPSMQEIQAAMDNMSVMFTPKDTGGFETNFEQNAEKEATPTLPTMALDVSNLKLANPFGSPAVSAGSSDNNISSFPVVSHMIKNENNNNSVSSPPVNRISKIESKRNMCAIIESPTRTPIAGDSVGGDTPNEDKKSMEVDIAPAAPTAMDIKPANIEPTIANIFGDNAQNDTMIIHDDINEDITRKLTLQLEGSSDQQDQTNVVFSPPNISDNIINNHNNNDLLRTNANVVNLEQVEVVNDIAIIENKDDQNKEMDEDDVMPQSENLLIQKISQMESVESNDNDNDDGDVNSDNINGDEINNDDNINDEQNEESSIVINDNQSDNENFDVKKSGDDNMDDNIDAVVDNEDIVASNNVKSNNVESNNVESNDVNEENDSVVGDNADEKEVNKNIDNNDNVGNDEESEPIVLEENQENEENEENEDIAEKPAQVQFKVEIEYAEEEQQEQQQKEEQMKDADKKKSVGNQMSDPWKSDYETSDLESFDGSSEKGGENDNDNDNGNDDDNDNDQGKKRRASKSESRPQQLLQLNYYETTLNDESTDEEDSPEPGDHGKLYREDSRWKWQKTEMKKHEKQMKQELRKLQRAQDIAEMNDMMTYYRQQSEQMQ